MTASNDDWPMTRLGDITTKIGSGATPRGGKQSYKDTGISLIRSMNVYDFSFSYDELARIDEQQARQLENVTVQEGDVLLNITGASVARCCMVPGNVLPARVNQHVSIIRAIPEVADPKYIHYVINSPQYKSQMLSIADGGATRQALTKESIGNFEIPLPPLPTQRRIASILSAYDDLIENNTRRIAILEEMAQSLYREWFVHFRYPGHEHVPLVDSPLGPVPDGWQHSTIGEVAQNFDRKRKPLSSLQRAEMQGEYPYYGAAKIFDYIDDYLFDGQYLLMAEDRSVITAHGTPVLQMVREKFWVNNHAHILQGRHPVSTDFLYLHLSNVQITGYITGAAQPKITQAAMNRIPILIPSQSVLECFNGITRDFLDGVDVLGRKNDALRRRRDLLLPKLIAGEAGIHEWRQMPWKNG